MRLGRAVTAVHLPRGRRRCGHRRGRGVGAAADPPTGKSGCGADRHVNQREDSDRTCCAGRYGAQLLPGKENELAVNLDEVAAVAEEQAEEQMQQCPRHREDAAYQAPKQSSPSEGEAQLEGESLHADCEHRAEQHRARRGRLHDRGDEPRTGDDAPLPPPPLGSRNQEHRNCSECVTTERDLEVVQEAAKDDLRRRPHATQRGGSQPPRIGPPPFRVSSLAHQDPRPAQDVSTTRSTHGLSRLRARPCQGDPAAQDPMSIRPRSDERSIMARAHTIGRVTAHAGDCWSTNGARRLYDPENSAESPSFHQPPPRAMKS